MIHERQRLRESNIMGPGHLIYIYISKPLKRADLLFVLSVQRSQHMLHWALGTTMPKPDRCIFILHSLWGVPGDCICILTMLMRLSTVHSIRSCRIGTIRLTVYFLSLPAFAVGIWLPWSHREVSLP